MGIVEKEQIIKKEVVLYLMKMQQASELDILFHLADLKYVAYKDDAAEFYDCLDELQSNDVITYHSNDVSYSITIYQVWNYYNLYGEMNVN